MQKLSKLINKAFEKEVSLSAYLAGFLSLIFLRVFIEQFLAISKKTDIYEIILEIIHNALFFSILFLLLWIFLSLFLKVNPKKLASLFLGASFFVILPPILDMLKTGGEVYWSFYLLSSLSDLRAQFLSVFGHLPSGIVYFGTKITFLLAISLLTILVYIRTKNIIKTILASFFIYSTMFFMGSFPTLFYFFYSFLSGTQEIGNIQGFQVAQFFIGNSKTLGMGAIDMKYFFIYRLNYLFFPMLVFLLAALAWKIDRYKFLAILKNSRLPQLFYHSGLFFTGIILGAFYYPENFSVDIFSLAVILVLLISVWLSWKASVVINDLYDQKIDSITNFDRPLPKKVFAIQEYASFGAICLILALTGGMIAGFKFFFVLLAYQTIAWLYSAGPFRLKRFPILATFVSALASLLIFFLGFILLSPNQTIQGIPFRIILLLVIAYTVSIPLKDFKDIEGDRKDGVFTFPVIFGESLARIIIASGVFLSFVLSVFLLNERGLFWWAILFGMMSYAMIIRKKTKPRQMPWLMMSLVFAYGCILVWTLMKN